MLNNDLYIFLQSSQKAIISSLSILYVTLSLKKISLCLWKKFLMSSVTVKILAVGKSGKCWGCNFSKDSDAHRSPFGETSGCFLNREQPADVPRGEYLWIILIKKVPVHNGLIFLTYSRAWHREMSAFSCTQTSAWEAAATSHTRMPWSPLMICVLLEVSTL